MKTPWQVGALRSGGASVRAGVWTPVPRVVCVGQAGSLFQAGWLVAPAFVITAAHGVVAPTLRGPAFVEAVHLDFGSVATWADAVAVPQSFWGAPSARRWDVAVLRLAEPVAEVSATLPLAPQPPGWLGQATLWGYAAGRLSALAVDVRHGDTQTLRYPAVNLPGDSGGPLVVPAGTLQGGHVVGMHVGFEAPSQQGWAVRPMPQQVGEALAALSEADAPAATA